MYIGDRSLSLLEFVDWIGSLQGAADGFCIPMLLLGCFGSFVYSMYTSFYSNTLTLIKKKTKNKKQKTKAKMFTKVYHNFFLYTAVYAQKLMTLGHCTDLLIMDSQCHGAT